MFSRFFVVFVLIFEVSFYPAKAQEVRGQHLRLGFWNILVDLAIDKWWNEGIPFWYFRKEGVIAELKKAKPDILGLAEVLPWQMRDISEAFPGYEVIKFGFYTDAVFLFRRNRFQKVKSGWIFLSPTPHKKYSLGFGNVAPRLAVWGKLQDVRSKKMFNVVVTHLDGLGKARRAMVPVLNRFVKKTFKDELVILLGDFNIDPRDEGYPLLKNFGWQNLSYEALASRKILTHYEKVVDHVFSNRKLKVLKVKSWPQGKLSDHRPVFVEVQWP